MKVIFVIENAPPPPPLPPRHTPIVKIGEKYFCERCGEEVPSEQLDWKWEFWISHPRCTPKHN